MLRYTESTCAPSLIFRRSIVQSKLFGRKKYTDKTSLKADKEVGGRGAIGTGGSREGDHWHRWVIQLSKRGLP